MQKSIFVRVFVTLFVGISVLFFMGLPAKASPQTPNLSVLTAGVTVSLSWTSEAGATGYSLYYASYPYIGPDTIGSIDMGTQTSFSVDLWNGAAFYVAVTASNDSGESLFSNIELILIDDLQVSALCNSNELDLCSDQVTCSDAGGYWYDNVCNSGQSLLGQTEILGSWEYNGSLGPGAHTFYVDQSTIVERCNDGTLEVLFRIIELDNDLDRLRAEVIDIPTGSAPYGVGTIFFMTYELQANQTEMVLYFSTSDYLTPSGGQEGRDYIWYQKTH